MSNRAKVDREKGSQVNKKHKRFDSLMNEQNIKKESTNAFGDLNSAV